MKAFEILDTCGVAALRGDRPTSAKRFGDGAQYRVEIPSVEGAEAFRAVLDEADRLAVPVHRISQGGGIMLQTEAEIRDMVETGAARGTEVCLFTGPRATYDTGVQVTARSGRVAFGAQRGSEQLAFALEDVMHACELGLRSVLVSDLGLLRLLNQARDRGYLPEDLMMKVSIQVPICNAVTAQICEDYGAATINLPSDLPLSAIAEIRAAVDIPLDIYIESGDDYGGVARYYEIPEVVRVAAPVHLKFGLRNAASIYPSGQHLRDLTIGSARERVRRARIGLELLHRYCPDAVMTALPELDTVPDPAIAVG